MISTALNNLLYIERILLKTVKKIKKTCRKMLPFQIKLSDLISVDNIKNE